MDTALNRQERIPDGAEGGAGGAEGGKDERVHDGIRGWSVRLCFGELQIRQLNKLTMRGQESFPDLKGKNNEKS